MVSVVVVIFLPLVLINAGLVVVLSSNSRGICFVLPPPPPPPLARLFFLKAGDTGWLEVIKLMSVVVVVIRLTRVLLVVVSRCCFSRNLALSIIKSFSPFKRRRPDLELVFIFLNLFLDFLEIRFRIVGRKLSSSKLKPFSVTEELFG